MKCLGLYYNIPDIPIQGYMRNVKCYHVIIEKF